MMLLQIVTESCRMSVILLSASDLIVVHPAPRRRPEACPVSISPAGAVQQADAFCDAADPDVTGPTQRREEAVTPGMRTATPTERGLINVWSVVTPPSDTLVASLKIRTRGDLCYRVFHQGYADSDGGITGGPFPRQVTNPCGWP
jgi:hypothetical protein